MVLHEEGRSSHLSHDDDDNEGEGALERLYDSTVNRPCQAIGYCKTLNYCGTNAMDMTLCSPNINFLSVFRSYHGSQDSSEGADSTSPYIYSSSAPIGPASCEYCGKKNTEECESNLPLDCYSNHKKPTELSNNTVNDNEDEDSISMKTPQSTTPCPRPKLFFLKKKPPFATPEGWNPITEYRNALHEPPTSSMEARMAAWGEVRGAVGKVSNRRSCKGNHHNQNQSGYGESEASFSSGGGGASGVDRVTSEENDVEQQKSPIKWVSGLLG